MLCCLNNISENVQGVAGLPPPSQSTLNGLVITSMGRTGVLRGYLLPLLNPRTALPRSAPTVTSASFPYILGPLLFSWFMLESSVVFRTLPNLRNTRVL